MFTPCIRRATVVQIYTRTRRDKQNRNKAKASTLNICINKIAESVRYSVDVKCPQNALGAQMALFTKTMEPLEPATSLAEEVY